jgi:serine/threonine protein kinase
MADLFLAAQQTAPREAAPLVVKILRQHLQKDTRARTLFENEARITSLMRHPNVVRGFDHGVLDERLYLVLEHLAGPNLEAVFERCHQLGQQVPVAVCRSVGLALCDALHYVHELSDEARPLGIVHRDVSPANVLLTRDGALKLLDFGLARREEEADAVEPGALLGSVAYVAPEQLEGEAVDRRADIFSVGVIVHELLTGRRLFWRGSVAPTAAAVCEADVPPARAARPELSDKVEQMLGRALARRRADRFPTAAALRDALEHALPEQEADMAGFLRQLLR